jgi:hypothetical protein
MIKKYTIYGERCSGTNYLEQLMLNNFDIELTQKYGRKHFFGFNDLSNSDDVLFIGIVRNIVDWANSFYREKHHLPQELKKDVYSFLNKEFYSVDVDNNEIMKDRNIETKKRYKNIFELRKIKNKFLIEKMPKLVKNFILITYDNLVNNFKNVMNKIKSHGLVVKKNIKFPVNVYYYKKNKDVKYVKKENDIKDELILSKANFYYEKKLFPKFNNKIKIKITENNADKLNLLNDKYYKKILNVFKNQNVDVIFRVKKKLLDKNVISFYESWKNGHLFNDITKKLPKNIKNVFLRKI